MSLNESLLTVVVESLAFFRLAPDECLVDRAAAEDQEENALDELRRLVSEEREEFAQFALNYAAEEEKEDGPSPRVEFFRELAAKVKSPLE